MPACVCLGPLHAYLGHQAEATKATAVGLDDWNKYCEDTTATKRRATRTVWVGKVPLGSEHPIAKQTMTTTDTNDVEATVAQVLDLTSFRPL